MQHFPYLGGLTSALRQPLAILLLLIHLFYSGGYRLVFDRLEAQTGNRMITRIDADAYDERELVEVRVPVNLPYQANWPEFERYNGEIYMDGVHYNYVKRKLHNDTLILLCLPNQEKTYLLNARETFFSLVNDLQQDAPAKQAPAPAKFVKFIQSECIVTEPELPVTHLFATPLSHLDSYAAFLLDSHERSPEQPPDARLG
jgi:hypothetical protein